MEYAYPFPNNKTRAFSLENQRIVTTKSVKHTTLQQLCAKLFGWEFERNEYREITGIMRSNILVHCDLVIDDSRNQYLVIDSQPIQGTEGDHLITLKSCKQIWSGSPEPAYFVFLHNLYH